VSISRRWSNEGRSIVPAVQINSEDDICRFGYVGLVLASIVDIWTMETFDQSFAGILSLSYLFAPHPIAKASVARSLMHI
jgi:hypothetical protein